MGRRIAVLASRFNESVTRKLADGATDALVRHGIAADNIDLVWVPGAWELPAAARRLLASERYDALVVVGAVIRGETPHFDYIAGEAARGLAQASADYDVPLGFGLLTTDTTEQAEARAGGAHGNKGWDAALAALEMVELLDRLMPRRRPETRARARALQALYAWDLRDGEPLEESPARCGTTSPSRLTSARSLAGSFVRSSPRASRSTTRCATSPPTGVSNAWGRWSAPSSVSRPPRLLRGEPPPRVTIQEAVWLAERYGSRRAQGSSTGCWMRWPGEWAGYERRMADVRIQNSEFECAVSEFSNRTSDICHLRLLRRIPRCEFRSSTGRTAPTRKPAAPSAFARDLRAARAPRPRGHVTLLRIAGAAARTTLDGIDVHRVGTRFSFPFAAWPYWRRALASRDADVLIEDITSLSVASRSGRSDAAGLRALPAADRSRSWG